MATKQKRTKLSKPMIEALYNEAFKYLDMEGYVHIRGSSQAALERRGVIKRSVEGWKFHGREGKQALIQEARWKLIRDKVTRERAAVTHALEAYSVAAHKMHFTAIPDWRLGEMRPQHWNPLDIIAWTDVDGKLTQLREGIPEIEQALENLKKRLTAWIQAVQAADKAVSEQDVHALLVLREMGIQEKKK